MDYKIDLASNNGTVKYCNDIVSFTAQSDNDDTRFSLSVEFPDWEDDAYVFLPACAYDGNKFEMVKIKYPPAPPQEYCKDHYPPVISDVPNFNNTFTFPEKVKSVKWLDNGQDLLFTQEGDRVTVTTTPQLYGHQLVVKIAKIEV